MLKPYTLDFYSKLKRNNNKEWFDNHRKWYEEVGKDNLRFATELLAAMQTIDPGLRHLKPENCIFRINRDLRFSSDKTPYKTHLGILMTPGGRKLEYGGYFVHLEPEGNSFAGGGCRRPLPDGLKRIRQEIVLSYEEFKGIVTAPYFLKYFSGLDREKGKFLSRPPKGFDAGHPGIEYLKLKNFTATRTLEPQLLSDPMGLEKIFSVLSSLKPLNDFLNRALKAME